MEQLLEIMRRLRDPLDGCPWDAEQDFASIAPYTIEEAYEVADAIEKGQWDELRDELGDLLLQVVFHAQMASEEGLFDFGDVTESISAKLVRRHPHVFGEAEAGSADAVTEVWATAKAEERRDKGMDSLMDGVAGGMPELLRALKLQKRAGEAGFDWPSAEPVLDKVDEEVEEIKRAITSGQKDRMQDEIGDLLFATVNLARKLKIDPGGALRHANAKFEARFRAIEEAAGGSSDLAALDLDDMETLWQEVKSREESDD